MKTNKFLILTSDVPSGHSVPLAKYLAERRMQALKNILLGLPLTNKDDSAIVVNMEYEIETKPVDSTGFFGGKTTREVPTHVKFYVFTTGDMSEENTTILSCFARGLKVGLSIKE